MKKDSIKKWFHQLTNFKVSLVFYTMLILLFFVNAFYFSQNYLANYALQYLSANTGFELSAKTFRLDFFGEIYLQDVLIRDREKRPMIKVHELRIKFSPTEIYKNGEIVAESAYICGAAVNLWYHKDSKELNINEWIDSFSRLSSDTTRDTTYSRFVLKIPEIYLEDAYFSMNDVNEDSLPKGEFDYFHFQFSKINAKVKDFRVADDTIELYADKLAAIEPNNIWRVHSLSTFFRYSSYAMTFDNLDVHVGQSHVRDYLGLFYADLSDFSDFNNKVRLKANIVNSRVSSTDLALFSDFFRKYDRTVTVNGTAEGTVADLHTDKVRVKLAESNLDFGKMHFKGFPEVDFTKMKFDLKNSTLIANDILHFVPEEYHGLVKKLGRIHFKGDFNGVYDDFTTLGSFQTDLGGIDANVKMNLKTSEYVGSLALQQFDLGKWADEPDLGKISMRGSIEGKGFKRENVDFKVNAQIDSIFALQYVYQNLQVDGEMQEGKFNGKVAINDKNLKVIGEGLIDITDEKMQFKAKIDTANLQKLKLMDIDFNFSTYIDADFVGLDIDKTIGNLKLFGSKFSIKDKKFNIDTIQVESEYFDSIRHFNLKSDWADIYTSGFFNISRLYEEIYSTSKHYLQYVNDSIPPVELKVPDTDLHKINIDILCKNLNPLLRAYVDTTAFLSSDAFINGQLLLDEEWNLFLNGGADSFAIAQDNYFNKSLFQINANKNRKKAPIHANFDIASETQKLFVETQKLYLNAQLDDKAIQYQFNIDKKDNTDTVALHGDFDFSESKWLFRLFPDTVRILEYDWKSENELIISYTPEKITFEKDILFKAENQEFLASGAISQNPEDGFFAKLRNFDINILSQIIGYQVQGAADLDFSLHDAFKKTIINAKVLVKRLKFEDMPVGDLGLNVRWLDSLQKFSLDGGIKQKSMDVVSIGGFLDMKREKEQLDAVIKIINGRFDLISPFVKDILSDLEGRIFGAVKVSGRLDNPQFGGEIFVSRGAFRIDYLNTNLRFEDKIIIQNNGIVFDRVKLTDKYGQSAFIEGGLYYENYENFMLDMRGELYNVLVLNTTAKDNSLYHGTAFASGDWQMSGTFDKINIVVNLKTDDETKFYLPIGGAETAESSFIRFKSSDSLDLVMSKMFKEKVLSESNIKMTLNFDISPSAYMEIIFDQKAGDIIRGNAKGKMKMIIDTEGDFRMYGNMEIVKGAYNFTLMNVINKAFSVSPGSTITWDGDPYGAKLNITANYRQMASLAPIIIGADSVILKRPEVRRKYPVIVDLHLRGDLMSPDIDFDIQFKDYPTTIVAGGAPILLDANVQAFKQRIENDIQELNRQVFSLIVLKKLSEPNNMVAGINQTAINNLSELLTNQLSAWLSEVDENLQVDIDINGISAEALNTLQLRLSYNFFDKRMRLTREGTFTNVQNQTNFSSVMGDWILEYNVTQSGRLRLKAYYRNNFTNFDASLQSNANSGGSILYSLSFDNLKELFHYQKKKKNVVVDDEIILEKKP